MLRYLVMLAIAASATAEEVDWSQTAEEAARTLQEYIRFDTTVPPGDVRASADFLEGILEAHSDVTMPYTALAALELRAGNLGSAESLLESAADIDPGSVQVNLLLGDCRRRLGRPEDAQEAYQHAFLTDPSEIAVPLALADLGLATERADEAVSWASVALLLDEDNTRAHRLMSRAQEAVEDYELAAYHLRRARNFGRFTPEQEAEDHARMVRLYELLLERERAAQ